MQGRMKGSGFDKNLIDGRNSHRFGAVVFTGDSVDQGQNLGGMH